MVLGLDEKTRKVMAAGTVLTQAPRNLIGLAQNEKANAGVLGTELLVQTVLKFSQRGVLVAGNSHCGSLVAGSVDLDEMLQRVVVEVVWRMKRLLADDAPWDAWRVVAQRG
jgi:hypothetical protein